MTRFGAADGVRGPLADFLSDGGEGGAPASAERMETFLGPLLQALVVDDLGAARRLRDWFLDEWDGGGSLLLLPLDSPGLAGSGTAGGAAWTRALLDGVNLDAADPLSALNGTRPVVGSRGEVVDSRGIIRLGTAGAGEGILARRESLGRLRAELAAAAGAGSMASMAAGFTWSAGWEAAA